MRSIGPTLARIFHLFILSMVANSANTISLKTRAAETDAVQLPTLLPA